MADQDVSPLRPPSDEHRRIAAESFERANQVAASGNYDYAIQLMLTCCKIDPGNPVYRQTLRRIQKAKYNNNLRGSTFAFLTTARYKARLKVAKQTRDYLRVLEYGEQILSRNPWDVGTQMDMAVAFDALGLPDLAIFSLDQARQKNPKDVTVNRALARMLEKTGRFAQAIKLWQLVREAAPDDLEAAHKAKDLAASETIQRGRYSATSDSGVLRTGAGQAGEPAEPVDRLTRESAPLLAQLEADPTDHHLYLQLAGLYRSFGQPDKARAVLQQGLGPTGSHHQLVL
ncbi:MAG TPA: tetratricopeptide repeat protein, partial [Gemmataceae bacterium]